MNEPSPTREIEAAAKALLGMIKALIEEAGMSPMDFSKQRRLSGFSFGTADHNMELRYIAGDLRFQLASAPIEPERQELKPESIPLVFDASTNTFVGTEPDHDIGLEPGHYRPRKTAVKVIVEAIKKADEA